MKSLFLRTAGSLTVALCLAPAANAQVATNFSKDVNTAIDAGLEYFRTTGKFAYGTAGDRTGLVALALLEKRSSNVQNASATGYSGASDADQAALNTMVQFMVDDELGINGRGNNGFYSYRNGQVLMALALYIRTGGPNAQARQALDQAFDEAYNQIISSYGSVAAWHGYFNYFDVWDRDSSTTQYMLSGLAAARGIYNDPLTGDATRLARLNEMATRSAQAYAANATSNGLSATERGHRYNLNPNWDWSPNSLAQTGSGAWIMQVGGLDLNSIAVQGYLEWLRNRYNYENVNSAPGCCWPGSYGYYLWSTSKAFAFLDDAAVVPTAGHLTTADLGVLPAASAPAFGGRQLHLDPSTVARPARFGGGGAGYYADPRELPRWYFDFAYTVISRQQNNGYFSLPNGGWEEDTEQAYHILVLQRSVGGGCLDADGDDICDADDNCPQDANADQADGDSDGLGDSCDACRTDASNDADGDGSCGAVDNCPNVANANQVDSDADGLGDACDACALDANNDADGDGVCGNVDNCASANPDQTDSDRDGLGDACDACALDANNDADADGVCGNVDNCPAAANANQADTDGDGIGDVCDTINPPSCDDGSSDDHNPKHKHVHGKGHSSHGKGKGKGHDGKSCDDGSSDDHSSDGKSGKSRDKSDDKSGKAGKGHNSGKKPVVAPKPAPKPAPKKK